VAADPNIVTEALEVLLDRADRGEKIDRALLLTGLGVDAADVAAVVDALAARRAVTELSHIQNMRMPQTR
jgi:energy-converting hydrogenase Eha subunit G